MGSAGIERCSSECFNTAATTTPPLERDPASSRLTGAAGTGLIPRAKLTSPTGGSCGVISLVKPAGARVTGKRITQSALFALREALAVIYWYKPDFESFVRATVPVPEILVRLNFSDTKSRVAGELVDRLAADQDKYLGVLLDLRAKLPPSRTSATLPASRMGR
jgi:hypothetical protein